MRALEVVRPDGSVLPARVFVDPAQVPVATVILAHGAGAPQAHPFMVRAAGALALRRLAVVTFDFPYTAAGRKLPDKAPVLERAFLDVIAWARTRDDLPTPLVIGGKSMGGRMASHVAAHHAEAAGTLAGLVFLGYPLHPPARPTQRRDAHLPLIRVPMFFVQGSRDALGTPDELRPVLTTLTADATLYVVEGADHGFAVSRRATPREPVPGGGVTPRATTDVLTDAWDAVARWVAERADTTGSRHG